MGVYQSASFHRAVAASREGYCFNCGKSVAHLEPTNVCYACQAAAAQASQYAAHPPVISDPDLARAMSSAHSAGQASAY